MTRQRICVLFLAAALFALPIQPGARADAGPAAAKASGEVNFQISCGPAVQKTFKEAVWTLHSFWYPEALKGFTAVTEAEPGCAMGYWGIAMSHWYPLWFPPSPAALKAGAEAVSRVAVRHPTLVGWRTGRARCLDGARHSTEPTGAPRDWRSTAVTLIHVRCGSCVTRIAGPNGGTATASAAGHFRLCGAGDLQLLGCHSGAFHPGSDFLEGDVPRDVRRTMFWLHVDAEGREAAVVS